MVDVSEAPGVSSIPRLRGYPIVGCLPHFRRDRLALLLEARRRCGDIARVPILSTELVVVTKPEIARTVLVEKAASFRKSVALARFSRPMLGDGLLTSEGGLHRRQRKLIAPGLQRRTLGGYIDTMARHAEEASSRWRDGQVIDTHAEMARLTVGIASETMFGTSTAGHAEATSNAIRAATSYIATEVGRLVHWPLSWPTPRHRRLRRAIATLDEVVYDLIRQRRAKPRDGGDILGMLLDAQDEDDGSKMTDQQVRDEVMTLFVAGHDTLANALTWSLYVLARDPELADRLAAESREVLGGRPPAMDDLARLPLATRVFKETLRLYPAAYLVGREATEPVELGGHRIEAGTTVMVSIYGMHRRPEYFPDPERFDPDRFLPERERELPRGAYLPFADGPRICIGNHFALVEGQIVLAHLMQRARFSTEPGPLVAPQATTTLSPRGRIGLRVDRR